MSETRKVEYINVKCSNPARKRVYAKLKKMAENMGIDMTQLIIISLDNVTRDYDDWYFQQQ